VNGAWLLVWEFFSWRKFRNRRELGSLSWLRASEDGKAHYIINNIM
jgi:hypothetical protein